MAFNILAVCIGGALGALLRYFISQQLNTSQFPIGTISVNLIAAFLAGIFYVLVTELHNLPIAKNFLLMGFTGSLSTLSTVLIEFLIIIEKNSWILACSYMVLTMIASIIAAASAVYICRFVLHIL